MKTTTFTKHNIINVPADHQASEGCVAFQLISYVINYFGSEVKGSFGTKIMADGTQIIVDGDGFFESGSVFEA